jgi:uncharacterized membrane protein
MSAEPKHHKSLSARLWWFILTHVRRKLGAGLLVVIPLGITLFILRFLFNLADGLLAPYIRRVGTVLIGEVPYLPGLGMIAGLLLIYFFGILATNVFGRQIVQYWDGVLTRIPVVRTIYVSAKQLIEVFSRRGGTTFRQAVYIDFPKKGSYTIAFVTNEVVTASGKRYYTCFIPTSPNPTAGYVVMLHDSNVYPTSFSVEEAMKIIMSGGMVSPEIITTEKLQ